MYGIIFLFLALLCLNPNHKTARHQHSSTQVTTLDDDSGDSGHVPPKPPPPPPPPPTEP